jgi:hypothetical protein
MEIVVKGVDPGAAAGSRVASDVETAARRVCASDVRVEKVFPDAQAGQRARLYVVHLPEGADDSCVQTLLKTLRQLESVESASVPAPRRPLS